MFVNGVNYSYSYNVLRLADFCIKVYAKNRTISIESSIQSVVEYI